MIKETLTSVVFGMKDRIFSKKYRQSRRLKKGIVLSLIISAGCVSCTSLPVHPPDGLDSVGLKWDSIGARFKDVNALYAAYIAPDGRLYEYTQGLTAQNEEVDENTLFEGASLSKTYFACLFWNMILNKKMDTDSIPMKKCGQGGSLKFSPFELLSHTVQLPADSCTEPMQNKGAFAYSENCYLALQHHTEQRQGKDLQQLAAELIFSPNGFTRSSFLWDKSNTNFVDGYYTKTEFHRDIHKYDKPAANGSLYLTGKEFVAFVRDFMNSRELDSMQVPVAQVPGYPQLKWGRGIGIELNNGKKYCWQWATNWSFKSFLLINTTDKTAFVCLTNSVSGAEAIRNSAEWTLNTRFDAFTYLGW